MVKHIITIIIDIDGDIHQHHQSGGRSVWVTTNRPLTDLSPKKHSVEILRTLGRQRPRMVSGGTLNPQPRAIQSNQRQ